MERFPGVRFIVAFSGMDPSSLKQFQQCDLDGIEDDILKVLDDIRRK